MAYPDEFPETFSPSLVIPIRALSYLHSFESRLAPIVDPEYDEHLWAARVALKHLLRPKNFNGNILGIKLTVMEDPYEKLMAAQEQASSEQPTESFLSNEGKIVMRSRDYRHDLAAAHMANFIGFSIEAGAFSGKNLLTIVQQRVWYGAKVRGRRGREALVDEALVRVVTAPEYDEDAITKRHQKAVARGFRTMQGQSSRTRGGPTRIDPSH